MCMLACVLCACICVLVYARVCSCVLVRAYARLAPVYTIVITFVVLQVGLVIMAVLGFRALAYIRGMLVCVVVLSAAAGSSRQQQQQSCLS